MAALSIQQRTSPKNIEKQKNKKKTKLNDSDLNTGGTTSPWLLQALYIHAPRLGLAAVICPLPEKSQLKSWRPLA